MNITSNGPVEIVGSMRFKSSGNWMKNPAFIKRQEELKAKKAYAAKIARVRAAQAELGRKAEAQRLRTEQAEMQKAEGAFIRESKLAQVPTEGRAPSKASYEYQELGPDGTPVTKSNMPIIIAGGALAVVAAVMAFK